MGRQLAACAVALALISSAASAETVVAPGDLEFVEGNSNNCYPYTCGSQRYQQVYEASHFHGISGVIDQIRHRVESGFGSFSKTYSLEIRLSHTSATATTLSTVFEDNIGGDETLVLDESAIVISGTGGSSPNPFDIIIDVDDLFTYNGVDNLLVDITVVSGRGGPQFDSTNRGAATDKMQRVWGCVSCSTGSISGDEGLVTAFEIIPTCFVIDAIDDQFSVINDGTTTDLPVLANDECDEDTPITVVGFEDTVPYTPPPGFVGFDEFTYTAQDGGFQGDPPTVDRDTATVVVDVLEDLIPDAVDDVATTLQDQDVTIHVLENDSLGNAPNTVAIETEPANGGTTVEPDNSIRYSPNSNFFGEDSFEYRLTDANEDSDIATVTVGVFFVGGQVSIDIAPKSDGNSINLKAGQRTGIDIAILSAGEFFEAPILIDPLTLKFGPRGGNIWGSPLVRDVDGDGDDDLVVKFLIQQSGIACGDTHATVFGSTFYRQAISGSDVINTFNCPRIRKRH